MFVQIRIALPFMKSIWTDSIAGNSSRISSERPFQKVNSRNHVVSFFVGLGRKPVRSHLFLLFCLPTQFFAMRRQGKNYRSRWMEIELNGRSAHTQVMDVGALRRPFRETPFHVWNCTFGKNKTEKNNQSIWRNSIYSVYMHTGVMEPWLGNKFSVHGWSFFIHIFVWDLISFIRRWFDRMNADLHEVFVMDEFFVILLWYFGR